MSFTSFDGNAIEIAANGGPAALRVRSAEGTAVKAEDCYGRQSA